MTKNIGRNIKVLAQVCGWLCLIAGIIVAIILWSDGWYDFDDGLYPLFGGIGLFLSAWPLYGFGQLIEDVSAMRKKAEQRIVNGQPTGNADLFGDLPDL